MGNPRKFSRMLASSRGTARPDVDAAGGREDDSLMPEADKKALAIIEDQLRCLGVDDREIETKFADLKERREIARAQRRQFEQLRDAILMRSGGVPAASAPHRQVTIDDVLRSLLGTVPMPTKGVIAAVQGQSHRIGRTPSPAAVRARLNKHHEALGIRKHKLGRECYWWIGDRLTEPPEM